MARTPTLVTISTCAAAAAMTTVVACRDATQITVVLTTDVPCANVKGATITVGVPGAIEDKDPAATSGACGASGSIGSVVVVPSGDDSDEVGIKAVIGVGKPPSDCKKYGPGCIVARRALHYIPHTGLVVPIHLESSCDGVACDPNTTCVHGACVAAEIPDPRVCEPSTGCDEGVLYPDAGYADARPDSTMVDAPADGPLQDATIDASVDAPADTTIDAGVPDATVACGDMGGLAPGAPWPMGNYCPTRLGRTPFVGPQTNHLKWSVLLSEVYSATIGADGTIYLIDNGVLRALAPDGGAKWSSTSTYLSSQAPTLGADGNIYVGAGNEPNVYVFAASDGHFVTTYPTGFDAGSAQLDYRASNGMLLLRVYDRTYTYGNAYLATYDVSARRTTALAPIGDSGAIPPALASNGEIVGASLNGVLHAVAADGTPLWTYDTSATSAIIAGPVLFGGRATIATYAGMQSRDALDGGFAWTQPIQTVGQLGLAGDGNGTLYAATTDGLLVAIRASDGTIVWQTPLPNAPSVWSTPVIDGNGTIYVAGQIDGGSEINAVRPDGGVAWTYTNNLNTFDSLALGNGVLIVHTDFLPDGGMAVYAIGP
jgi:outer membrane protein assembly factor BamB